jgi:parallel beta-helix repeat protein
MTARERRTRARRRRRAETGARGRLIAVGGLTAGATLAFTAVAQAEPFEVTNLERFGEGSLQQAVSDASDNPGPDSVVFSSALTGTIHVPSKLFIFGPLSIEGPGADRITVSGDDAYQIFYAQNDPGEAVSISGLTLADGYAEFGDGGAVYNQNGPMTISNSVIRDSSVYGISGHGHGGAVASAAGSVTIENSTITGNYAYAGGAIASATGDVTIRSSTLDHNYSTYGGGVYTGDVDLVVSNSTMTQNHASNDGGAIWQCCGDPSDGVEQTVTGSTISGNVAGDAGGGISLYGAAGSTLQNSIVSGNTADGDSDDLFRDTGYTFDGAFSLIGVPGTYATDAVPGSNLYGVDPQLGGLAENGGSTETMLPASGSPVVNKGSAFGLSTDQRGLTRPVAFPGIANSIAAGADGSDIGAVEVQVAQPNPSPVTPVQPKPHKKKCKKHKKKHKRSAESAKKKKCKKKKKNK